MPVCKILMPEEWAEAQGQTHYAGTALDRRDGFIHLSFPEQVAGTLQRFYAGQEEVVVLTVDETVLGAALKTEEAHGQGFPHLYAALPLAAVRAAEKRRL